MQQQLDYPGIAADSVLYAIQNHCGLRKFIGNLIYYLRTDHCPFLHLFPGFFFQKNIILRNLRGNAWMGGIQGIIPADSLIKLIIYIIQNAQKATILQRHLRRINAGQEAYHIGILLIHKALQVGILVADRCRAVDFMHE